MLNDSTTTIPALNEALAGRYVIEQEVGHGGMATVFVARDVRHDRRVALKLLKPELAAVIGAARFAQEIRTTANLQHPHILPLHDSGEVGGTVFYVMPFVEGETLRDRLARDTQLPVDEAVRLIQQVASALDYAHRQRIVHRDIKPENILLQDGQALVADFGIALAASRSDGSTRLTETGMSLGTPSYMSPEQAMGQREVGPGADVYALGCVLYEMLVGEPPFTGPTAQAVVAKVITDRPPSVTRLRARVPEHVDAAIQTALEKLPADRFPTARAFADALTAGTAVSHATTAARATAAGPRAASRRTIALAAAGGVALGAGVMYLLTRAAQSEAPPREWSAQLLGGSLPSATPRASPDGQQLAFAAVVRGQSQVALLSLASGDRTILTRDTTRGIVSELSWSHDNERIYYTRFFEVPRGVYYVSRLGGEEHLLLENAGSPAPLRDGSLLITRPVPGSRMRAARYWPESGRIDSLDATMFRPAGYPVAIRAFPDGERFAFIGRTSQDTVDALRVFEIATGRAHLISNEFVRGFAITPDGRSIVASVLRHGMHHLMAFPQAGGTPAPWLTLPFSGTLDVGPDGSLYTDQGLAEDRPNEVVRISRGVARVLSRSDAVRGAPPLALPDGRVLVGSVSAGRFQVTVHVPDGEPIPFVQTNQPTSGPLGLLGRDRLLLTAGAGDSASLAVVSIASRRIVTRFAGVTASQVGGSADGSTVYLAIRDTIFSMPSSGGKPTPICTGDAFALDPGNKYLIVSRVSDDGVHLVRRSLADGAEELIPLSGNLRFAPSSVQSNSVAADGRILVLVVSPALWSWPVALLDPRTGSAQLLPIYDGVAGWTPDGDILGFSNAVAGRLWRFRPQTGRP